jgi:hypothetical protein
MASKRLWALPIAIIFGAPGAAWLAFMFFGQKPEVTFRAPVAQVSGNISSSLDATDDGAQNTGARGQELGNGESSSLPRSVQIDVPFVPQAPFALWDDLHQEACEEMSFLLTKHYLDGTPVTPELAERELQEMVRWMTQNGYAYDVTVEQLAGVIEEHYGMKAAVTYDIEIDDIKHELARGNPVILPLAGQRIGNPYFSGEGPPYHMLVVTGYDNDEFVTNDVGTKRGEGFRYPQHVLFDAIHDWTGDKETIDEGRKAMLVVTRKETKEY